MPKLEDIDREIKDIEKRMRRFKESGDLKRLVRLRPRLLQAQEKLNLLRTKEDLENAAEDLARLSEVVPASFRRSYSYEFYLERLHKFLVGAV